MRCLFGAKCWRLSWGPSADKPAVAILIVRHALLELSAVVAAVHLRSVDVEVLADTGAAIVANVVNDCIFVLIARALGAPAAGNAAGNIQLVQEKTELLASKKSLALFSESAKMERHLLRCRQRRP